MTDAEVQARRPQDVTSIINQRISRPSAETLELVAQYSASQLSDGMNRFNALDHAIKPVAAGMALVGPAFTVKLRAADNLFLHKATLLARTGDVLVVDVGGDCSNAVMGDLLATFSKARGVAGIVVDGAARDLAGLRKLGLPVFARGITPAGPDKDGPGHINIEIACGGVPIRPGDIIVGDDDGVVVVPPEAVRQICEEAQKKAAFEEAELADISAGKFDLPWVDQLLIERGYTSDDPT
jgi:RraA family protein